MILLLSLFSLIALVVTAKNDCHTTDRESHTVSYVDIQKIIKLNRIISTRSHLKKIFNRINLIRPVGSLNHAKVKEFIKEYLILKKWQVEETAFSANTVIGNMNFVNIIGTQNITKSRRLVLACHYDSLKKNNFYGSTDSALPCAMMLSIINILTPLLQKRTDLDVSLELIFFDGEEAFIKWSETDSLYGSKYLARLWDNATEHNRCSRLTKIDSLVLLDLLGAYNPKFYFFNNGNYKLFESLVNIENTINQQENIFKDVNHPYFNSYATEYVIEDDHLPFLERGVSVVHLIPIPFPRQWHKRTDNAHNIDWKSSKDLELILSVFVVQYFNLGPFL